MVLKIISPGCGVRASLMLFFLVRQRLCFNEAHLLFILFLKSDIENKYVADKMKLLEFKVFMEVNMAQSLVSGCF